MNAKRITELADAARDKLENWKRAVELAVKRKQRPPDEPLFEITPREVLELVEQIGPIDAAGEAEAAGRLAVLKEGSELATHGPHRPVWILAADALFLCERATAATPRRAVSRTQKNDAPPVGG